MAVPRTEHDDLADDEKGFFDLERLTNPYVEVLCTSGMVRVRRS